MMEQIKLSELLDQIQDPLEDDTKGDEWRKEVGLGPLADYVANWGIKFEPRKK